MTEPQTMPDTTLILRRRFAAPRARVFEHWTDPGLFGAWYAFADTWETLDVEIDLRAGGHYRITWGVGEREFGESGEYLEVVAPERLVYTVTLSGTETADIERTVCTVEFLEHGDETEVVITEEGYPSVESRDLHASGWPKFLDRLERIV